MIEFVSVIQLAKRKLWELLRIIQVMVQTFFLNLNRVVRTITSIGVKSLNGIVNHTNHSGRIARNPVELVNFRVDQLQVTLNIYFFLNKPYKKISLPLPDDSLIFFTGYSGQAINKSYDSNKCAGMTTTHPTWSGKPPFSGTMFDITKTLNSMGTIFIFKNLNHKT